MEFFKDWLTLQPDSPGFPVPPADLEAWLARFVADYVRDVVDLAEQPAPPHGMATRTADGLADQPAPPQATFARARQSLVIAVLGLSLRVV